MSVIAVLSSKGGVGRATLTLALADYLAAQHQRRVLLIDLDPQMSLTLACLGDIAWNRLEQADKTAIALFGAAQRGAPAVPSMTPVQRAPNGPATLLIPGTPRLGQMEPYPVQEEGSERPAPSGLRLPVRDALATATRDYDYTLIVCPPALNLLTVHGLAIADGYLMPVTPTHSSANGIKPMSELIKTAAARLGRPIRNHGTVLNRVDPSLPNQAAVLTELANNPHAAPVWQSQIPSAADPTWTEDPPLPFPQRWGTLHPALSSLALEFVRRVR